MTEAKSTTAIRSRGTARLYLKLSALGMELSANSNQRSARAELQHNGVES
jgi:hypothetical protein